jgi:glycosyltransferase involved in cell wall biosynthesis
MELLTRSAPTLSQEKVQWVWIGGDGRDVGALSDPSTVRHFGARAEPDDQRRLFAGADCLLWLQRNTADPTLILRGLRYGVVPIAPLTGGCCDCLVDFDPTSGTGTAFCFSSLDPDHLVQAWRRALSTRKTHSRWHRVIQNGMDQDFSWRHSGEQYNKLYSDLLQAAHS